eukprot:TRINITY_DN53499_c0_g1_i1.p1 TRINITY_DN53499_c0_g1~~TRINITY_DN53499_c0_g1_i1.p1  ORF type:complete len:257 (-),score=42.87 TRINITY_DN53499_c0_g1_i1:59-829(-)
MGRDLMINPRSRFVDWTAGHPYFANLQEFIYKENAYHDQLNGRPSSRALLRRLDDKTASFDRGPEEKLQASDDFRPVSAGSVTGSCRSRQAWVAAANRPGSSGSSAQNLRTPQMGSLPQSLRSGVGSMAKRSGVTAPEKAAWAVPAEATPTVGRGLGKPAADILTQEVQSMGEAVFGAKSCRASDPQRQEFEQPQRLQTLQKSLMKSSSAPVYELRPSVKLTPPQEHPYLGFGLSTKRNTLGHEGGKFGSLLYWGC